MLPQEIRDIIKKEAFESVYFERAYEAGATKYAELMIEFAEWLMQNGWISGVMIGRKELRWVKKDQSVSTSDLLTIFFKEKSNLANENNIV